jgi:hypothetical protein
MSLRLFAVLTVATACVGASAGSAAAAVTPSQLALMPLPKGALGPGAIALPLDPQSGVQTKADTAQNATGQVTVADLTKLGLLTGYALDYNDAGGSALLRGRGLLEVDTGVELYRDDAAATHGLAFWRKDDLRVASVTQAGIDASLSTFAISGVGSDNFALFVRFKLKGKPTFYGADVVFRDGSLLAEVSISAADRAEVIPLARRVAPALKDRIALVLAGRIKGSAVPLPGKLKAGPPPHGPELSRLTLAPSDLGTGRTVTHQGYQLDKDLTPVSEYAREMRPAGSFLYLSEEVALFHSPLEAGYTIDFLAHGLSSAAFVKSFGGPALKTQITSYRPARVALKVGDESYGVIADVLLSNGVRIDEGFVAMRIGKTTEFVAVGGRTGTITASSLTDLANTAAARAKQGLASSKR